MGPSSTVRGCGGSKMLEQRCGGTRALRDDSEAIQFISRFHIPSFRDVQGTSIAKDLPLRDV